MRAILVGIYKVLTALSFKIKTLFYNYLYNEYLLYYEATLSQRIRFRGPCVLQIKKGSCIEIGNNFKVYSGQRIGSDTITASKIVVLNKAHLKVGNNCGIANTVLWCREEIIIGDYANIGTGSFIMDNNFHSTDWRIRMTSESEEDISTAPVHIKDHAFIGARSIVCKGVTIGEHSIVAAGSVVVKDIPDNEVWGGNPAQFIRKIEKS